MLTSDPWGWKIWLQQHFLLAVTAQTLIIISIFSAYQKQTLVWTAECRCVLICWINRKTLKSSGIFFKSTKHNKKRLILTSIITLHLEGVYLYRYVSLELCVFTYPSFEEVPCVVDSTDSTRPPTACTVQSQSDRLDLTEAEAHV